MNFSSKNLSHRGRWLALGHVHVVDDAGGDHGRELVEELALLLLAREPHHGTDVQGKVVQEVSRGEVVHHENVFHVLESDTDVV